jgi:glycosyltransferase involved in cell wall biosynthesis
MVERLPLVSVVCLCYNQRDWIEEAVDSVQQQTYPNIELVIADDGSTDGSQEVIRQIHSRHPDVRIFLSDVNRGNCAAFNAAFRETRGEFVVDLAADDVMLPERIEKQVKKFAELDNGYGVVFTDADYIDAKGRFLYRHFDALRRNKLIREVPEGDVFREVVSRYFIAAPTMLIRRAVLDAIGGYDEMLAYEDFDFWVRSSRFFKYAFLDEPLTKIRKTGRSMSSDWYKKHDPKVHSTYIVCRKAMSLCRDDADRSSLIRRARYEFRQCVLTGNRVEANHFLELLGELKEVSPSDRVFRIIKNTGISLSWLRKIYHAIRFRTP